MPQFDENKPYIFISYSHRDSEDVLAIVERLRAENFNVWYDEGIDAGTEWDQDIADHIMGCSYFIGFISANYVASDNCKDEINYGKDKKKPQLLVYMDNGIELPEGLAMRVNRIQAIYWDNYENGKDAFEKLCNAEGIQVARISDESQGDVSRDLPKLPGTGKKLNKKLLALICAAAILVCGIIFGITSKQNTINKNIDKGMSYLTYRENQNYDPKRALACFEKAANKGSNLAVYLEGFILATGYGEMNRFYEGALDYYIQVDETFPWAYAGEAELYGNGRGTMLDKDMEDACYELFFAAIDEDVAGEDSSSVRGLYWYVIACAYEAQGNEEEAIKWYTKAAETGFVPAINDLGIYYVTGQSLFLDKDTERGRELFTKAAKTGYGAAYDNLGQMEINTAGGSEPNYEKAAIYYEKAMKAGNTNGCFHLGQLAEYGYGRTANFSEALEYYEKAADANNPKAIRTMGLIYFLEDYSDRVETNYIEAVDWFEKGAYIGDVSCMFYLGQIYYTGGKGIEQDYVTSCDWFLQAADGGSAEASNYLGVFFEQGMGFSENIDAAIQMYIKSADSGNEYAMYNLGLLYENNVDRQDLKQAFEWYKKSADAGYVDAMHIVGNYYYNGTGMDAPDMDRAFYYYLQGAKGGNIYGIINLADMYRDGKGCSQNYSLAREWYEKILSSEEEIPSEVLAHAYYGIGYICEYGEDRTASAVSNYEKAIELGEVEAKTELGKMYLYEETIKDYELAFSYLSEASKDSPVAMNALGDMYYYGWTEEGVDLEKALECYVTAFDAGLNDKMAEIYEICLLLNDLKKYERTLGCLEKLSDAEYVDAMILLGEMYYNGYGISKNYDTAMMYFTKAADFGNAVAMKNIGDYYTRVMKDEASITKGIAWYKKAYQNGNAEAGERLAELGVSEE